MRFSHLELRIFTRPVESESESVNMYRFSHLELRIFTRPVESESESEGILGGVGVGKNVPIFSFRT
jgi:hypothetical protein